MARSKAVLPLCPRCGERDKVVPLSLNAIGEPIGYFCDRCIGNVAALEPRPGRYTPDDIGTTLWRPKKGRQRRSSTPRLVEERPSLFGGGLSGPVGDKEGGNSPSGNSE
jgi:hypothetical protein